MHQFGMFVGALSVFLAVGGAAGALGYLALRLGRR